MAREFHRVNQSERKQLRKLYLNCVRRESFAEAVECLYKASSISAAADLGQMLDERNELRGILDQLLELAFSAPGVSEAEINETQAARLFDAIFEKPAARKNTGKFNFSMSLN